MKRVAFRDRAFLVPWGIYLQIVSILDHLILQIAQPYPDTTYRHQQ